VTMEWVSPRSPLSVMPQRKAVSRRHLPPHPERDNQRKHGRCELFSPDTRKGLTIAGSTVPADNRQVRMSSRSRRERITQTKTGHRADRESLRVAMLAQRCGIDEIAAELPVRWGFALLAAHRHANRLTPRAGEGG
jgi:hypothetical protein